MAALAESASMSESESESERRSKSFNKEKLPPGVTFWAVRRPTLRQQQQALQIESATPLSLLLDCRQKTILLTERGRTS